MITFKEFLAEIGDAKVSYTVKKETSDQFVTVATVGKREVTFSASDDGDGDGWHVEFSEPGADGRPRFGATGSGSEFKVASFIVASLQDLIGRYSPDKIFFTSEIGEPDDEDDEDYGKVDTTRADVYVRLIQKKVKGYKVNRGLFLGDSEGIELVRT